MKLKLFIEPQCARCPAATGLVKQVEHKVKVEIFDMSTAEGLAEALFYSAKAAPSIVIVDNEDKILKSWKTDVPTINELNEVLK